MPKTIIIVGAGIAGLSTGCYAQMNDYKATIFESHRIPGGLCAAWARKGYSFDLSMHMVTCSKRGPLKKMWDELGVTVNQEFHYHDRALYVDGKDKKLDIAIDRTKLEEQLLAISPDDRDRIIEFLDLLFGPDLMDLASLDPPELQSLGSKIKMVFSIIPWLDTLRKYSKVSIQEFTAKLKDPFLRQALRFFIDSPGWPMIGFPMIAMAGFAKAGVSEAGCPLGGSHKIMLRMADWYKNLGGDIRYKSIVKDVIIENDQAIGVKLEDGTEHRADIVVWAGDGHHLIFDILGGKYMDDTIRNMYEKWIPVKPVVHVCLGVDMDLSNEPSRLIIEAQKPIKVGNDEFPWLNVMQRNFDKSFAPQGKTALEVWLACDYKYWEHLAKDRPKYDQEKQRIAEEIILELDYKWPGLKSKVEMIDVATPMTYVRYTGNWQGSPDGWYITTENAQQQNMKRSLPGLANLYMVGQWTAPFMGTVMSALSGRQLIQILCKKEKQQFKTKNYPEVANS